MLKMELLCCNKVRENLDQILPNYEKTKDLVQDLNDLVFSNYHNLYNLFNYHSEYVKNMEEDMPCNEAYSIIFQVYYYSCLYGLHNIYTLDEIFRYINKFQEYDIIDKTLFKVLFNIITQEEAESIFINKITSKNLFQVANGETLYIKFRSDSTSRDIHPNEEDTESFLKSKLYVLYSLFMFI